MRMRIGVSETFSSAHFIPGHWKCGKVHGHNFRVEVEVEGELKDGMVMDFYDLKKMLKEVLDEYDHRLLNDIMEIPTSEHICMNVFGRLNKKLESRGLTLVKVRVFENEDKWAELSGL
jgi:6-pyruvoyltetrahydropterin/6-carboxytetrahydropterin synthase